MDVNELILMSFILREIEEKIVDHASLDLPHVIFVHYLKNDHVCELQIFFQCKSLCLLDEPL